MDWALDADTLMWLQIATGFTGALTLVYLFRCIRGRGAFEAQAYFSPRGGCQDSLVQELQKAQHEILVQAYSFTADPLTFALIDAKKRGVNVEVLLDRSNEVDRYSDLHILLEKGLAPLIDAEHAIAHNKVVIIDQKVIVTGSYNFTNQAEGENAENMVILKGHPELARQYRENFMAHKAHCKPAKMREAEKKDRRAA
jgi:phosphatidylserine/phosphatidylglycerophosphate/cardiolipin synthase-like enzyme